MDAKNNKSHDISGSESRFVKRSTRYFFLELALLIIVLDQISKYFARKYLMFYQSKEVINNFWNWSLAYNKGAAFSFLNNDSLWPKIFFGIIALLVAVWLVHYLLHKEYSRITGLSFSFILGGAVGNLFDRILWGKVTDFIDWYYKSYHWPTFNLADSFICIGVVVLIIENLFFAKEKS